MNVRSKRLSHKDFKFYTVRQILQSLIACFEIKLHLQDFAKKMVRIEPVSDRLKTAEAINEVADAIEENIQKGFESRINANVGGIKDDTHKKREKILAQKLIQNSDETEVGFRQKIVYLIRKSQKSTKDYSKRRNSAPKWRYYKK